MAVMSYGCWAFCLIWKVVPYCWQGSFFDNGVAAGGKPQDINGWFEMQSFRAREVPVLARLLSLGSFTGIADTLSGDGIAFDVAQFKFTVHDGRLRVKSGRFNGPALGLTKGKVL